jgi:glycosyltransferase involved in cell wall biosynthesis
MINIINQQKINLVIASNELDMGGAQHLIYELVKNIDYSKYAVTIICTDNKTNSLLEKTMLNEALNGRYTIIFLKERPYTRIKTRFTILNKIIYYIKTDILYISNIIIYLKLLNKIKPDIIHAHGHGIWAGFWTIPHGVPFIATVHTNPKASFHRISEKIILYISLFLKKIILVAISQYNCDLIKYHWKYKKVRCINNGIEIKDYYNKPHDKFAFINVSRQDKNKNQIIILNAFLRLYNENKNLPMLLYLIGDGDCHNLLVQKTKEYKLEDRIIFTGYIDSAKDYYAVSDVYISSSFREGLPLSVLEAMAAGLPVIATNVGGLKELVHENGILINNNDENELYLAMKKLRDNSNLRMLQGKKSLEMVKDYSAAEMTKQYCELFEECVKK